MSGNTKIFQYLTLEEIAELSELKIMCEIELTRSGKTSNETGSIEISSSAVQFIEQKFKWVEQFVWMNNKSYEFVNEHTSIRILRIIDIENSKTKETMDFLPFGPLVILKKY